MSTDQLTPRQLAEQRIAEQEAAEREERLDALEVEEERRRERAAEEERREEARAAARAESARLAVVRAGLEDEAQAVVEACRAELGPLYDELAEIHAQHANALRAARPPRPPRPANVQAGLWLSQHPVPPEPRSFSDLWREWIGAAFEGGGWASLREMDVLATTKAATEDEGGELRKAKVSSSPHARVCAGLKADGSRCSLPPVSGKAHCVAHDPARAEARTEAARVAGRARHAPQP